MELNQIEFKVLGECPNFHCSCLPLFATVHSSFLLSLLEPKKLREGPFIRDMIFEDLPITEKYTEEEIVRRLQNSPMTRLEKFSEKKISEEDKYAPDNAHN